MSIETWGIVISLATLGVMMLGSVGVVLAVGRRDQQLTQLNTSVDKLGTDLDNLADDLRAELRQLGQQNTNASLAIASITAQLSTHTAAIHDQEMRLRKLEGRSAN